MKDKVFLRARRTVARISRKPWATICDAHKITSYAGRFRHFDVYQAFRRYISSKVDIGLMRKNHKQRR